MRTSSLGNRLESGKRSFALQAMAGAFILLVLLLSGDIASAQANPGRLNTLQYTKPVAPDPVPRVERLRQDIIRAIDPRFGTIDVKKLAAPALPSRPGPGTAVGFEQTPNLAQPSRPGGGTSVGFEQVGSRPGPSREGHGSQVGFDQIKPAPRKEGPAVGAEETEDTSSLTTFGCVPAARDRRTGTPPPSRPGGGSSLGSQQRMKPISPSQLK